MTDNRNKYGLSDREQICLENVANGMKAATIAHGLGVHPKTVEKHLQAIRRKMNAKSTCHAVAIAVTEGMIRVRLQAPDGHAIDGNAVEPASGL